MQNEIIRALQGFQKEETQSALELIVPESEVQNLMNYSDVVNLFSKLLNSRPSLNAKSIGLTSSQAKILDLLS